MATSTTFVSNLATLQKRLHLTGVPSTRDSQEMIEESVRVARTRFFRELGTSRVLELQALPSIDPPTTKDQVLRQVAEQCEVRISRLELSKTLPMAFLPSGGDAEERWNQEGLLRDLRTMLEEMQEKWELQIQQDMDLLSGAEDLGEETVGAAYVVEPDETPPRPGESISLSQGCLPW